MDEPQGREITDIERGLVTGLLIGEGHFGGMEAAADHAQDACQARGDFHWLVERSARPSVWPLSPRWTSYYQWMARGQVLAEDVLPVVESG